MTDIFASINTYLTDASPDENMEVFGLAKLMLKGEQIHPVADLNNTQIAINDRYNGVIYHRVLSSDLVEVEDQMFGKSIRRETVLKARTVIAYKKINGRDFIYTLVDRIPETLVIAGYKYINTGPDFTINEDDDSIYNVEFSGGDYEKRREPWIIRAVEYDIRYMLSINCPTTP